MFVPRRLDALPAGLDADGLKLYSISVRDEPAVFQDYAARLQQVKAARPQLDWASLPAFAILHEGVERRYLVLAWWDNQNEMFTSVSVSEQGHWLEDPTRWSFCLFDLEILWAERNFFVQALYGERPDLQRYRSLYHHSPVRVDEGR